jgi:Tol biopolymer transport system component
MGAVPSPDGRYIYFSKKTGTTWSEKPFPNWSLVRHDLTTGQDETLIASPGGAMRPALSHDGRSLVYASREGDRTGLRLRNLVTGADRWLRLPIDHDAQDQGYYSDLEPRYAFTPDDKALILSVNGKLARLGLDGTLTDISFTAPVKLGLGPQLRVDQPAETGPVKARIIQSPRMSPDGRSVAFAALGTLYRMALSPGAKPEALATGPAYQPSWSPDGERIAYVTWSATDAGQVWSIPSTGGKPQRLTSDAAFYTEPVFSPDGRHLLVLRASQYDRLHAETEISQARPTDILLLPAAGGAPVLVAHAHGAHSPSFSADGRRIRFDGEAGLESVALDGSDDRHEARIIAPALSQYVEGSEAVQDARLNPSSTQALVKAASELYLIDLPPTNGSTAPTIDLSTPTTHVTRLTRIGADYLDWSPDGRSLTWSVGATFRRLPLAQVTDGAGTAEATAENFPAVVEVPRDVPRGTLLLHGATAITMRGDEVIPNADILVVDDHIAAIGKAGTLTVPAGATVRDVTGKFITPGFVDTHAHWFEIRREILDRNHWDFLANLAYGVTSGLDVQAFTVDVFSYLDMIDAGLMTASRQRSTC